MTKSYGPVQALADSSAADGAVPPFSQATLPALMTLVVHLDRERPLSEPKWVKTGDVQEWLKSMFGRMFWVAGDAAEGWEKKIEVRDPDPVCLYSTSNLSPPEHGSARHLPSGRYSMDGW